MTRDGGDARAGSGRPVPVLGINRRNLEYVFADYRPGRFRILDDKLATKDRLEEHGIATPRTLHVVRSPAELSGLGAWLSGLDEFVIKPARGWGGRGIMVLAGDPAGDGWVSPGGGKVSPADLAAHVADILSGVFSLDEEQDVAVFEERIHAHPFFAAIYPRGLADLRVVLDRRAPIQAMCRLPADASDGKANLHAGGVGLGIDVATGVTTGAICRDRLIERHPDTDAELVGLTIPHWETCLELSRRAAETVDFDYLGVDIVVDRDRGPLILELNARPGLAIQLANRQGQPVASRSGPSRFDRTTSAVAWVLFALMAVLPLGFEAWQLRARAPIWVEIEAGGAVGDPARPAEMLPSDLLVTDDEEEALSGSSEIFAAAQAATVAGDTAAARRLYESALADTALAPFALNNLALMDMRAGRDSLAVRRLREAIASFPAYGRGHYNLGLILLEAGRTDEAIAHFEQALAIQPSHAGSWANLGQARFEKRDYAGAEAALLQAVRYRPDALNARLRLGLTYRLLEDLPRAEHRFAELLALNPGSEAATYWWARTVMERRRAGENSAVSRDSLLVVLAPHLEEASFSPRCGSLAACLSWENGDRARALALFRRLVRQGYQRRSSQRSAAAVAVDLGQWELATALLADDADDPDAVTARLRALSEFGAALDGIERPDADGELDSGFRSREFAEPDLEILRRLLMGDVAAARRLHAVWSAETSRPPWFAWALAESDPDSAATSPRLDAVELASLDCDPDHFGQRLQSLDGIPPALAHWVLMRLARERGDAEAAAVLEQSLADAAGPQGVLFRPLLVERVKNALADGNRDAAADAAARLLEVNADDEEMRLSLAEIEMSRNDPRAAARHLERLSDDVRQSIGARVLQARIHLAENDSKSGLRELNRVLDQAPDHLEARILRGTALFATGKRKQAERELEQVLARAPGRVDVRRTLALQLMKSRRYGDAVPQWRRIERLGAATDSDRFQLGLALQREKRYAECLPVYDAVIAARPDHRSAWFNRSLALEQLGRTTEAMDGYRHVLTLDPEHQASRRKLGLRPAAEAGGNE